ncbi:MAG: hypothetical protein JXQ27_13010 [Acidobacteria bacterium]|nr:hypothetical protein [Acidobacteriota bacterium]
MSESGVRNLGCPDCGGVLDKPEGGRVAVCSFCHNRFFIDWNAEARYVLPRHLDRRQAAQQLRQELQRLAGRRRYGDRVATDTRFFSRAAPNSFQLYYVPFFRYSGLKVGTSPTRKEDGVRQITELGDPNQGEPALRTELQLEYKIESKVMLAEVALVLPALHLGGDKSRQWGLDALLSEDDFYAGSGLEFLPFQRAELEQEGVVLTPYRSPFETLQMCRHMYAFRRTRTRDEVERSGDELGRGALGGTRAADRPASGRGRFGVREIFTMDYESIDYQAGIVGDGIAVYYCPVWRVELAYEDRVFEAFVDGCRSRVLSLEVPVQASAKPWRLFGKALAGGLITALFWTALSGMDFFDRIPLFYSLGIGVFLAAAWWVFRELSTMELGPVPGSKVYHYEDLAVKM